MNTRFERTGPLTELSSYPQWAQDMIADCESTRQRVLDHDIWKMMMALQLDRESTRNFMMGLWPFIERFPTQFVTQQAMKECHLPKVPPNSLLIAITGQGKTLGNSAITRIETCINQHLAYALFHSPKIVPDFVLWIMQTRYDYLHSIAHGGGSTKGALTCGFLKTLPVPIPSRDEQEKIVATFQTLEDKQSLATRNQVALQDIFRTILHELMTAKT